MINAGAFTTVASTWESTEKIRPIWNSLRKNPNSDPDFFRMICETRSEVILPLVLLVNDESGRSALAIGRLEHDYIEVHVGYLRIIRLPVLSLTVVHGGMLGDQTEITAKKLCDALLSSCDALKADCVKLSHISLEDTLFRTIKHSVSVLRISHCTRSQAHWKAELPASFEEMLESLSAHHRKQLRRTVRNCESRLSNVRVRVYTSIEDLPVIFADVETIAKKTYQRQLGAGFRDDAETRRRVRFEAEKGWLRMFVLYTEGAPVAYWWGQSYKGCFFSSALGYDPAYARHSPGTYLMVRAFERLCQEKHRCIDFGLGDALYKRQFGTVSCQEGTLYLFPSSIKGYTLNCAVSCTNAAEAFVRSVVARLGVLEKIKTWWRSKLREGDQGPGTSAGR